jgi:hypothetical protein
MEASQLKVALEILEHARIPTCLVGEVALNYYNVPRALHVSNRKYRFHRVIFYADLLHRISRSAFQGSW